MEGVYTMIVLVIILAVEFRSQNVGRIGVLIPDTSMFLTFATLGPIGEAYLHAPPPSKIDHRCCPIARRSSGNRHCNRFGAGLLWANQISLLALFQNGKG